MQLNRAPKSSVLCELLEHIRKMFKSPSLTHNFSILHTPTSIREQASPVQTSVEQKLLRKCMTSA